MSESLPSESPSMSRRQLLTSSAVVVTTADTLLYPGLILCPPTEAGEGGSILAKDINGNLIPASQILAEPPGTRALVAGLAAEPTYLTVQSDSTLHPWGITDNCTHLGCTFPW